MVRLAPMGTFQIKIHSTVAKDKNDLTEKTL